MPLDVTITDGATTYKLKAESAEIFLKKTPLVAPVPGADAILNDLGQRRTTVTLTGVVDETATSEGGTTIPNKANLLTAAENWSTSSTVTVTFSSDAHIVKVDSLRLLLVPAQEDRWQYTLVFVK